MQATEFRSAAQLWAPSPALLANANLISLTRLGHAAVPNPRSTTGPVGFDYVGHWPFSWNDTVELVKLGRSGITHLETDVPEDLDLSIVVRGFPALETLLLHGWIRDLSAAAPMLAMLASLRDLRDVILWNIMDSHVADDAFFVDRLPRSNVHFVYGGGEVYRSYLRRDGALDAVFTDTSTKGGFMPPDGKDYPTSWADSRMAFISRMPRVSSADVPATLTMERTRRRGRGQADQAHPERHATDDRLVTAARLRASRTAPAAGPSASRHVRSARRHRRATPASRAC